MGGGAVLTDTGREKLTKCHTHTGTGCRLVLHVDYRILSGNPRAVLTPGGEQYFRECRENQEPFRPSPETHFVVLDDLARRVTLPDRTDVPAIG